MLAIRALIGGTFVVLFALLGEILTPKRWAGVFSAAPSVALANLIVLTIDKGPAEAATASQGMIIGAIAFVAAALAGVWLVREHGAKLGSAAMCGVWLLVAVAIAGVAR